MNRINRRLILTASPFVMGFLMFYLIPLFGSIRYSFLESAFSQRFVGWDNYTSIINNPYFILSVENTLILIALGVPLLVIASLCLALLINKGNDQFRILRAAFVLPMLLPSTAVASVFSKLPFEDPRIPLLAIYVWKNSGFLMLILIAALSMIPKETYEAAAVDGAEHGRLFFSITLPLISGTLWYVTILAVSFNLRLFREAYLLYGSYPDTRVYLTQHFMNNHFFRLNYQKLTTVSTLFSFVLFIGIWISLQLKKKLFKENDWQCKR